LGYPKRYRNAIPTGVYLKTKCELKYVDAPYAIDIMSNAGSATAPYSASTFRLLNGIAQGNDNTQRIGRSITIKSIQLSCHTYKTGTPTVAQILRIIIFIDKQANGANPTNISSLMTPDNFLGNKNLVNDQRFQIIHDKELWCDINSYDQVFHNWYKKMNLKTTYQSTGNGIADISTNAISVVVLGSSQDVTNRYDMNLRTRIRYTDE
jgi:hypothetical protein